MIRFFDMFAGVGGFRAGLERAGGFECIGHCEIDKFARASYEAIHQIKESEIDYEDARKIDTRNTPDFDLLTAGFPCQSFSLAGKRGGFSDPRGTLFYEIARVVEAKRPAYLLLENVPGLLSHDRGRTFDAILSTLSELRYGVEWQILDSQDFSVPQARRRVYIVGYLDPRCAGKILPLRQGNEAPAIHTEDRGKSGVKPVHKGIRVRFKDRFKWAYPGDCVSFSYAGVKGRGTRVNPQLAYTIDTQPSKGVVTEAGRIRKFTPRECLRLQGFEDAQIDKILAITSDSQAYKQAGNAVTVSVVAAVGKRLAEVDDALKNGGLSP